MKLNQACVLLSASLLLLSPLWLRAADDSGSTSPIDQAHAEAASRQQLLANANAAISEGELLLGSDNYDEAAKRFQYAVDALTPGGVSATSYQRAEAGLAAAKAGQAQEAAKDEKFAQAASLLQESIVLQPDNPVYAADLDELKKEQIAYEEQVRDPEGTTNNPAVTDDFKAKVATVQKLLFQGDCYFRTGQYDKAEDTYSKILILDPYNKAARDKMNHVERYKFRAAGFRHEEYEQSAMEQVNHDWTQEISTDIVTPPTQTKDNTGISNRAIIARKLNSLIIDKVNFEKLDIASVIQFLQDKTKELDPDHQGINFVLRLTSNAAAPVAAPGAGTAAAPTGATPAGGAAPATATAPTIHREVSITLTDVPLADVLNYITQQTNLTATIEDYAVYLRPSVDEGETMTIRTYLVPPNFFTGSSLRVNLGAATSTATPATVESVSLDVQKQLVDKGIRFPAGATATFLPGSSKLVVRDTPEQLDLIANLIDQMSKETPQVQIEAKIAEFTQEALKALSFNIIANNGVTLPLTTEAGASGYSQNAGLVDSKFGGNTALRTADAPTAAGLGGLNQDGIDTLINDNRATAGGITPLSQLSGGDNLQINAPNVLEFGGVIDGVGLAVIMNAINNLQGVSLLSAPSVTTQNGLKANIDIVREFPYPTSFDKPKLSNNANLEYTAGPGAFLPLVLAVPPTPREFVTQDVGVSLEVKPTTYPDKRIDLAITKAQVLDFDGFIDYGVPIVARTNADVPDPTLPGQVLSSGTINQPVFNLRSMVTDLQVLDGQTAVLGGLIREDTQEINDKVPVLGDVPILGRLFQSKVSERTKKDLIIFVTAKLIKTNGKPMYMQTLEAEPQEEALPEPEALGPGITLPPAESVNTRRK